MPKGVCLSHRNLLTSMDVIERLAKSYMGDELPT
jgi:long-subunit acyl-CoA synthetase (AMP-forming)